MNQPDINEINAVLTAVSSQRNQFADQVAVLQGRLAAATARIAELEKQLKGEEPGEAPSS